MIFDRHYFLTLSHMSSPCYNCCLKRIVGFISTRKLFLLRREKYHINRKKTHCVTFITKKELLKEQTPQQPYRSLGSVLHVIIGSLLTRRLFLLTVWSSSHLQEQVTSE